LNLKIAPFNANDDMSKRTAWRIASSGCSCGLFGTSASADSGIAMNIDRYRTVH
jgi:hypothetical protein